MSYIAKIVGDRIKIYRNKLGYSQETLAEKANLHNTYIGQLERGEKNATLESIEKICLALNISIDTLFKNIAISEQKCENETFDKIYNLLFPLKDSEQNSIYNIVKEVVAFKNK